MSSACSSIVSSESFNDSDGGGGEEDAKQLQQAKASSPSKQRSNGGATTIKLPKTKLELTGKALDKFTNMNSSMQNLGLKYCDYLVFQYSQNPNKGTIQNQEAFLLKRLRDFGVYHHKSVTAPSSDSSKAVTPAASSNTSDDTTKKEEDETPEAFSIQLPKSKFKLKHKALTRWLEMDLLMRTLALEYVDAHMIQQRRRNATTTTTTQNNNNNNNNGDSNNTSKFFIRDVGAYLDKRLQIFATDYQELQRKLKSLPNDNAENGQDTTDDDNDNDTDDDDDETFEELDKSKVKIMGETLKKLYNMPEELQPRVMDYCDNLIASRKGSPNEIINEMSFISRVIDSFIKNHQRELRKQQRLQQKYKRNNNNNHSDGGGGSVSPSVVTSPSTSPTKRNNNNKKNNNNNNNKVTTSMDDGISVASSITQMTTTPPLQVVTNDSSSSFIELPKTKIRIKNGTSAMNKLSALSAEQQKQTIEYCDNAILRKRQDRRTRPIANETAYVSSIIDAYLLSSPSPVSTTTSTTATSTTTATTTPQKEEQPLQGTNATDTTSTSPSAAARAALQKTPLELPISKIKVIGQAMIKLQSLSEQEQVKAIEFCDDVIGKRNKYGRPIINETGYLSSLLDNFMETTMLTTNTTMTSASSTNTTGKETGQAVTLTPAHISIGPLVPSTTATTTTTTDNERSTSKEKDATTPKQQQEQQESPQTKMANGTKSPPEQPDVSSASQQRLHEIITELRATLVTKDTELSTLRKERDDVTTMWQNQIQLANTARVENQRLTDLVAKLQTTLATKEEALAKLQVENRDFAASFAGVTKALVTTQEEKHEALKKLSEHGSSGSGDEPRPSTPNNDTTTTTANDAGPMGVDSKHSNGSSTAQSQLEALQKQLEETQSQLADEKRKVANLQSPNGTPRSGLHSALVHGVTEKLAAGSKKSTSLFDFVGKGDNDGDEEEDPVVAEIQQRLSQGSSSASKSNTSGHHHHHQDIPFDFSEIFPENHTPPTTSPLIGLSNTTKTPHTTPIHPHSSSTTSNDENNHHPDKPTIPPIHQQFLGTRNEPSNSVTLDDSVKQELDFLAASYGNDKLSFTKNCLTRTLHLEYDSNTKESVEVHLVVTIPEGYPSSAPLSVGACVAPSAGPISEAAHKVTMTALAGLVEACKNEANASIGEENAVFNLLQTADQWVQIEWASIQGKSSSSGSATPPNGSSAAQEASAES